jgi:hypothetical protein
MRSPAMLAAWAACFFVVGVWWGGRRKEAPAGGLPPPARIRDLMAPGRCTACDEEAMLRVLLRDRGVDVACIGGVPTGTYAPSSAVPVPAAAAPAPSASNPVAAAGQGSNPVVVAAKTAAPRSGAGTACGALAKYGFTEQKDISAAAAKLFCGRPTTNCPQKPSVDALGELAVRVLHVRAVICLNCTSWY